MQRSPNIRVRLLFDDCTPFRPGSVGRRKCWFLLNIDACRRITDVEYSIQKTFCLGKSSQIELLLDDFVLPPFEKSEIIQENDLIRVRLLSEGDKQDDIEVEGSQGAEPNNPSKRKKGNTKAKLPRSSKDNASHSHTSTAERQKTGKGREMTSSEVKHDDRMMNGEKAFKKKENTTEGGQTSRLNISPSLENGTKKPAKAHKHLNKSVKTSLGDDSSSSSDSSSEGNMQPKAIPLANRSRKMACRRKVQKSKSVMQSSLAGSTNPGTSASGRSSNKQTKTNVKNMKFNGSGPLHSDSESSSTEEEAVPRKRKPSLKTSSSGTPNNVPVTGNVKTSEGKKATGIRTQRTPLSSSVSSMSSASSSSDSDESPAVQLQQKQTVQSSGKPGVSLPTKTTELPHCPAGGKGLSSSKVIVKKSMTKSSGGHVRFSSDSASSESEEGDALQPSTLGTMPSEQRVQQMAHVQRPSPVELGASKSSSVVQGGPHIAADEMQNVGSECDDNPDSALNDANGIADNGIQTKLLNIAGQKPKQLMKPKQLTKPERPKKIKDYSKYPSLVGPPRTGDIIAYKILELSTSYTPEVSDYKEGEVINFNHSTSMIELRLSDAAMAAEPKRDGGKFEMETEDDKTEDDQMKQAEPSPVDRLVLVTLPSLIDPKLIT